MNFVHPVNGDRFNIATGSDFYVNDYRFVLAAPGEY